MLVGREKDIEKLTDLIDKYKVVHLTGAAGIGKTSVIKEVIRRFPRHMYFTYNIETYRHLLSFIEEDMVKKEEIELITPTEFLDVIKKMPEENMLRFLIKLRNDIEENADMLVIDSADKYREFGAKLIEYLALYSNLKLILVTRKEDISDVLQDVISHLLLEGLAVEYELLPLSASSLAKLFPEADKSFIEYLLKITKGDINYMKLLVGLEVRYEEKEILPAIEEKYSSLEKESKEIINLLAVSTIPLKFEDICCLLKLEDEKVLDSLDKLSMFGWIKEDDGEIRLTSEKISEVIEKNINKEELKRINLLLGEYFEKIGLHFAAASHFEKVDVERSVVHYRTAGFEAMYLQNYTLALMYFKKAWELGRDITDLYYLAKMYFETGKIKESLSIIEGVEEDRFNYLRAWIYYMEGNLRNALKCALKCEKSSSPWVRIMGKIMLAFIYRNLRVFELSKDIAEEALKESESIGYTEGMVYSLFNIGSVLIAKGDKNGIKYLERAFELSANSRIKYIIATNYLYYLIDEGFMEKAKQLIDSLLKECRDNNYFYEEKLIMSEYGIYLKYTGEFEKAEKVFRELNKFFTQNNLMLFAVQELMHLGETLIKQGREEEGKEYIRESWEKALEMGHTSLIVATYNRMIKYGIEIR